MKNTFRLTALLLGAAMLGAPVMAKEKVSKKSKEAEEMMRKYAVYSTPGAGHQALTPLVGSFSHTAKWWMEPGAKPEISTGTTEANWILGGRFVESVVKGVSMGQPFEGRAIAGYDNQKKQYDSIWLDTMATGIMVSHGQYDGTKKTLTEMGSASCPIEGTKHFRGVTKIIDNDNHVFELYTNAKDGKEFRIMEMTYKRK